MAGEAKVQETLPIRATGLIRKEKLGRKEVAQDTCQRLGGTVPYSPEKQGTERQSLGGGVIGLSCSWLCVHFRDRPKLFSVLGCACCAD